jgi:DNA-binding Lrp family transcriptional regulator
MLNEILSGISSGTTTDALARELDLKRSTLMAIVESLVDTGYIEVVGMQGSCSGCGGSVSCSDGNSCYGMYALTLEGERFISQNLTQSIPEKN